MVAFAEERAKEKNCARTQMVDDAEIMGSETIQVAVHRSDGLIDWWPRREV